MVGACDICGDRAQLHQVTIVPGHKATVIRDGAKRQVWVDSRTAMICDAHETRQPRRERLPREGTKPGTSKKRPQREELW